MADAEAISQLRTHFVDAFNRADIDAMTGVIADDLVGMPPNQPALVGKDASRAWWKEGFAAARSRVTVVPQELQIGGDWAIDRFTWSMETTPVGGGVSSNDKGHCIWIWRRQRDSSWKLARAIWNSDNPVPGTVWSGTPRATS